jgi:hypothetical protein
VLEGPPQQPGLWRAAVESFGLTRFHLSSTIRKFGG